MKLDPEAPRPPKHLGKPGRALWTAIQGDFAVADSAGLALLAAACEARDRADAAREAIAKAGMTFTDSKGNPRPHPLLAVERDSRAAVVSALRALNLDVEPALAGPGRPPGGAKGKLALTRIG
jgi:P27 family predicted phage terminase small subunit